MIVLLYCIPHNTMPASVELAQARLKYLFLSQWKSEHMKKFIGENIQ